MFGEAQPPETEPVNYENARMAEPADTTDIPPITAAPAKDVPEPEPYSEVAWAQGAFTSSHEPQAEGALAFDSIFGDGTAAGSYEPSFESEQEPREWEPEHEPEADDVPTVSKFVSQSDEGEISLDALLEEIIKAGE